MAGVDWQGKARQGLARPEHGMAWQGTAGMATLGWSREGSAGSGMEWQRLGTAGMDR
jgi:hypothetical protein